MGITLVVNPGSSSKKYALYQGVSLLASAYVERSLNGYEFCAQISGLQQKNQTCQDLPTGGFENSVQNFLSLVQAEKIINSVTDIAVVVVRVVASGTYFQSHHEIDDIFMKRLAEAAISAPLHVPPTKREIEVLRKVLQAARFVAASDSAFHHTLNEVAREYSIVASDREELDIHRFGFHGLSVASVSRRMESVAGFKPVRSIVCHIGSGVSVTAIKDGVSFDTTMGYAPGSGLLMGSRAGDLDAGALLVLMQARHWRPVDAQAYLQTKGGVWGLGGEADLRLILERRAKGDKVAKLAMASFVYHIQKAIGSYVAVMGGLDLLVLTATASERSPVIRSLLLEPLTGLGIKVDQTQNEACVGRDGVISASDSPVRVVVIKTDEASEMIRVSQALLGS